MRFLTIFSVAVSFLFSVFSLPVLNFGVGANQAWAAVEEEEEDNTHKYAGEKGFRQGEVVKKSVEIILDGKSIGTVTDEKLSQLKEKKIYSPRGPKVGWRVMDALNGEGIQSAKSVHFSNTWGKRLDLQWSDLQRQRDKVVLTYNFNGELVLETDTSDNSPDRMAEVKGELTEEEEEAIRKEMHKNRQKSLIFLRNVAKIEIDSN